MSEYIPKKDPLFLNNPSGCTAVTVLFTPDHKSIFVVRENKNIKKQEKLIMYKQANAGDSRCIISLNGKSKALSYDHKPGNAKESKRIIDAGGFVEYGRVNGKCSQSIDLDG
jgi:serine/threonine protein phosphatase PrpC